MEFIFSKKREPIIMTSIGIRVENKEKPIEKVVQDVIKQNKGRVNEVLLCHNFGDDKKQNLYLINMVSETYKIVKSKNLKK